MKTRKLLDVSKEAIKTITIQAVKEGSVFKLKAEKVLENYAKSLNKKSKR